MSSPRVVVVGGGLAGLTAALACADGGADVTVLESRPRLGGATWSFAQRGLSFDNGQHVFLRCCTAYRDFLDRIGSGDDVRMQPRLAVPVLAGNRVGWLRRDALPAPLHLARALLGYPHLPVADRLRLLPAAAALRRVDPTAAGADTVTFADWLESRGQHAAAIDALWDLITLPTVNLPARQASLAMAAKVFRTGLLERSDAADIGWSRVPLGELHGAAAARALDAAGGRILTGVAVRAVRVDGDAPAVVAADGSRFEAEAVVVAVPHDRLAPLLPAGLVAGQERLVELGASPIVNVNVVYDRRVTGHGVAAVLGSPVQWVFDHTEPAGLDTGQCLTVSLSAAEAHVGTPTRRLTDLIVGELARLFPVAAGARVVQTVVSREATATFRAVPGSAALRPGPATAHPAVAVAGAWTDTGWPATMEGAVRSGLAAARHALRAAGRTRRLPTEVPA